MFVLDRLTAPPGRRSLGATANARLPGGAPAPCLAHSILRRGRGQAIVDDRQSAAGRAARSGADARAAASRREEPVSTNVAFIGLGTMGRPMAERLLERGFALRVHNRTAARAAPLAERGAFVAATPAAAVEGADLVVTMVADDDALLSVVLGAHGFADAMRPDALHIS